MKSITDFVGLEGLSQDAFVNVAIDLLNVGESVYGFENPLIPAGKEISSKECADAIMKHPVLSIGMLIVARLERLHFDYLEAITKQNQLLQSITGYQSVIAEKLSDLAESGDFIAATKGE